MLVEEREDYIAKTSGTRAFPWRVFIVSENDKQLADCRYGVSSGFSLPFAGCFLGETG